MINYISFSPVETEVLGLKIGRCNQDEVDETLLLESIIQGEFDLCRLKVSSEDENISIKLHKIGFPFFFSGSIRRYKTKIEYPHIENFFHPNMEYILYDGSQDNLLKEMLSETWGSYPLGYYRSPYLNKIINKNDELECVFRFYKKHNLHQNYPLNRIIFMKDQNNFVGFFALNIVNGNLESHIGGILKPFRKGKYFLDMLTYIKSFCVNNNLPYFLFGARNENPIVQKIFHEVGFAPIGTENVFHILPFLSHSKLVPLAINIKYDNLLCIDKIIFSIYLNKLNDKIIFYSKSINTSWHITPVIEREYLCKISLPVLFNDIYSGTVVVKYYDSKTLVGITYIDFDSFS